MLDSVILWVARDKAPTNCLWAYADKPIPDKLFGWTSRSKDPEDLFDLELLESRIPALAAIRFEDGPVRVEFTVRIIREEAAAV